MVADGPRRNQAVSTPVAVLVVTRNNLALSKLALKSVLAQDVPVELLVIDNASDDGTLQWLLSKPYSWMSMQAQKSLSYCWNFGLRVLFHAGHDRVLVINNDVQLRPDTARILTEHGGEFVTCVSVDSAAQLGPANPDIEVLRANARPHPDFSCFMISKVVTDKVGWFDEDYYPAFCEDSDYHVRMHRTGVNAVCIDLPFLHHGSSTIKLASPGETERIKRGAEANRQRFRATYGCLPGSEAYSKLFE
jgi:GT2 family glycosyltransferase